MRPLRTLIASLSLSLSFAGAAALYARPAWAASEYQRVLGAYERAGSIPPCAFTSPQLEGGALAARARVRRTGRARARIRRTGRARARVRRTGRA